LREKIDLKKYFLDISDLGEGFTEPLFLVVKYRSVGGGIDTKRKSIRY
jgi:hypothetical protein